MKIVLLFPLLFSSYLLMAQEMGILLIVSDTDCTVTVDASDTYEVVAATPLRLELAAGSHLLQQECLLEETGKPKVDILEVEAGKNLIFQIKGDLSTTTSTTAEAEAKKITLINSEITVPGGLTIAAQDASAADYTESGIPIFHYYFQAGDQVLLNIEKQHKKGTNSVRFSSYPDGNVLFSLQQFEHLRGKRIDIQKDGIYVLQIETNYAFDRGLRLTVDRFVNPDTEEVMDSRVEVRNKYEVVTVQEPTAQWINSTSNATWKGGKSRVVLPIQLPSNTVEWYYIFTASREEAITAQTLQGFSLAKDLGAFVLQAGGYGTAGDFLSKGIDAVTQPPGSDYCDVIMLDHNNFQAFESGAGGSVFWPEGTRKNFQSGKVRIATTLFTPAYLGFQNTDTFHGLSVGIEVAAVTVTPYYCSVDAK